MKYCLKNILIWVCLTVLISGLASGSLKADRSIIGQISKFGANNLAGPRRTLLSDSKEPVTALVVTLDGTIFLLERQHDSVKPLWAFPSGSAIYSSYQAPVSEDNENSSMAGSDYYIDCGDDWELYAHSRIGKFKLTKTLEEYVSSTPQIGENGEVVLGSKKTATYLVDAKTGRLIYSYQMPESSTMKENSSENDLFSQSNELHLFITRTDYAITSYAHNSNKVLWNVTVAEVGAASLCQESENSFDGGILDSGPSAPDFKMPLPCRSRALVFRSRNHNLLEHLSKLELPEVGSRDMVPPAPSQAQILPSQPHADKIIRYLPYQKDIPKSASSFPAAEGMSNVQEVKIPPNGLSKYVLEILLLIAALVFILTSALVCISMFIWIKNRKFVKDISNSEKKDKNTVPNGNSMDQSNDGGQLWLDISEPLSTQGGRRIGKLLITANEIAKGSNGTVVLEGVYEGRPVAVKRLVRAHHDIAFKEIQNLVASDRHQNIVRWFGVEQDQDFVYLSLERCICSLNDFVQLFSDSSENLDLCKNLDDQDMVKYKKRMDFMKVLVQDTVLWKANGYPSPVLLKLMRDVVSGLVHLHELGIIHRDIKPQNVLIIKDKHFCAKLSDMGISKRLTGDMASLGQHATGCGSSGWQAPEQLLLGRQTRAVDLFSIGCVLFFCVTGGRHPFGDHLERDVNIAKNHVDLFLVENLPEAKELLTRLLSHPPEMRPTAVEVLAHPLFWNAEMRLSFLRDTSDRIELEDRENNSQLLNAIESTAAIALGGKWDKKMDSAFLNNIGRYRRYKFDSVRDLLRVMRNKLNHYRELPKEIQEILGSVPEGFDNYFASRFPNLLIEAYKVMSMHCKDEELFVKYFKGSVL